MKNLVEAIEKSLSHNEVVRVDASLMQVDAAACALGYKYSARFLYDYAEVEDYIDVWGWFDDTRTDNVAWRLRVRRVAE